MQEDNAKIVLPKELQKQMIKFFLKTSVPRKKKEQMTKNQSQLLSEKNTDRSEEE